LRRKRRKMRRRRRRRRRMRKEKGAAKADMRQILDKYETNSGQFFNWRGGAILIGGAEV